MLFFFFFFADEAFDAVLFSADAALIFFIYFQRCHMPLRRHDIMLLLMMLSPVIIHYDADATLRAPCISCYY